MDEDNVELATSGHPGRLDVGLDFDGEGLGLEDHGGAAKSAQKPQDQGQLK